MNNQSGRNRTGAGRQVWLLTGGSRGLGLSVALAVARSGGAPAICAREVEALKDAERKLAEVGGDVLAVAGDVRDEAFRQSFVDAAIRRFGRIDVLLNNASSLGPSPLPPLSEYDLSALDEVYAANVLAPLRLAQLVIPHMRRVGEGVIINVTSDAAVGGYPGWGGYGSSKAALELISKTLHEELLDDGIRVFAVDPGDIRTQMHQDAFPGEDISDRPLPDVSAPGILWLAAHARETDHWRHLAQEIQVPAPSKGGDPS